MTKSNNKIMKLSPMTSSKNNVMRYKFHLNDVINKKIQDHLRLLEHSIHCLECNSKNCQKMKVRQKFFNIFFVFLIFFPSSSSFPYNGAWKNLDADKPPKEC